MTYIPGDFWRICDSCGFKKRASETRKRWDGLIVCADDWEPRHPQDFVKGKADWQNVPNPRLEPVNTFIGPLQTELTADVSASGLSLQVVSTVRFEGGDTIGIICANGEILRRTVDAVSDEENMTITSSLGVAAKSGALVVNYSAVSGVSL